MSELTQERLFEVLSYSKKTGLFTRNISRGGYKAGSIAGHTNAIDGYVEINVDGKSYKAQRLAYLYVEGVIPKNIEIDHRDRIRDNNVWENIRLVSHQCNMRNCNISKNNTSGITGVTFDKSKKRWIAQITIDYKNKFLGAFKDKGSAAVKRWEGEVEYNFPNCNSTSSAYLYIKECELI